MLISYDPTELWDGEDDYDPADDYGPPTFELCPDELRGLPNWVTWKYERPDANGKLSKMPYTPGTQCWAKTNTPSTWRTYAEAVWDYRQHRRAGLGFVFEKKIGYVFVDVDGCRDPVTGEIATWAEKIIRSLKSYTEISPSGTGVHIFIKAKKPQENCRFLMPDGGAVEVYDGSRYSTITGECSDDFPRAIEPRQSEFDALYAELVQVKAAKSPVTKSEPVSQRLNRFLTSPPESAPVDLDLRKRFAEQLLAPSIIDWRDGYGWARCPHENLHTSRSGPRDVKVFLDGAPTISCFHAHCKNEIDQLCYRFRSEVGKAEGSASIGIASVGSARTIGPSTPPPGATDQPNTVPIEQIIAGLWFDPRNPPPEEPVLISIAGVACATPGNLTTITAQKKSGKSAFLAAIAAAAISNREDIDALGVKAYNDAKKMVLHFDTEQSPMDHWRNCNSILRRTGIEESPIFKSLCLTSKTKAERWLAVQHVIRQEVENWTGVFIALLDGVADLVHDVNDPHECADFVSALHALAIENRCHIYSALHLNPGSDFKSRGHLGSELERKSQTNLRIEKVNEQFCVWGDWNRGAPIPKQIGPCFVWDDNARMHVSTQSRQKTKEALQFEEARILVGEAFRISGKPGLWYSELVKALRNVPGVNSESTARRNVARALDGGFITKNLAQQYEITLNVQTTLKSRS